MAAIKFEEWEAELIAALNDAARFQHDAGTYLGQSVNASKDHQNMMIETAARALCNSSAELLKVKQLIKARIVAGARNG